MLNASGQIYYQYRGELYILIHVNISPSRYCLYYIIYVASDDNDSRIQTNAKNWTNIDCLFYGKYVLKMMISQLQHEHAQVSTFHKTCLGCFWTSLSRLEFTAQQVIQFKTNICFLRTLAQYVKSGPLKEKKKVSTKNVFRIPLRNDFFPFPHPLPLMIWFTVYLLSPSIFTMYMLFGHLATDCW